MSMFLFNESKKYTDEQVGDKADKSEVNALQAQLNQFTRVEIVSEEPANPEEGVLYAIVSSEGGDEGIPVTDYLIRFDASELDLTDGANVSSWPDLSSNGHDVQQSDSALQPSFLSSGLNGNPTVEFDGEYLVSGAFSLDGVSAFTLFVVTDTNVNSDSSTVFSIGENNQSTTVSLRYSGGRSSIGLQAGGITIYADSNEGSPRLYTGVYDGATNTVYTNGLQSANGAATDGIGTHDTFAIGRRLDSSTAPTAVQPYYGKISEVILFPRELDTSELSAVNTYLMNKWGI